MEFEDFDMKNIVHKFTKNSLSDVTKLKNIVRVVRGKNEVIVISPSSKIIYLLDKSITSSKNKKDYRHYTSQVLKSYTSLIKSLPIDGKSSLLKIIQRGTEEVNKILETISLANYCSNLLKNLVLSYGSLWHARLVEFYLKNHNLPVNLIDTKLMLVFDSFDPIKINWKDSQKNLSRWNLSDSTIILPSNLGSNNKGDKVVVACEDYTSSYVSKILEAEKFFIWTDTTGIHTANIKLVKSVKTINAMSYKEFIEFSYFGTTVMSTFAINLLSDCSIAIQIKNINLPELSGTIVSNQISRDEEIAKGIKSDSDIALISVQSNGNTSISTICYKIFSILEDINISTKMVSQSSSEHSICFAIKIKHARKVLNMLEKTFRMELSNGEVQKISLHKDCVRIKVIGEGMRSNPGALSKIIEPL